MATLPKRSRAFLFIAAWILIGIAALVFLPLSEWLDNVREWILSLGWLAPYGYIGVYVFFCIFLIPSIALSVGVGPVFGFANGLLYTIIAANIGSTVAFLLGRTVLRRRVERWALDKPRFQAIDAAVQRNGFKIVLLLRMSPIFPFTITNYLLALTSVPFWKYAFATFIGMLPLNAAFIYVSCEAAGAIGDIQKSEFHRLSIRIAGIVMTLIAMAVISRIAIRAVKIVPPESRRQESEET